MKSLFKNIAEKWRNGIKWSDLPCTGNLTTVAILAIAIGALVLVSMKNPTTSSMELSSTDTPTPIKAATGEKATGLKLSDDIESQKKRRDTDKLTVADIIEGYLNNDPTVADLYSEYEDSAGWIYIKDKGMYYPGAVYDGDWEDIPAVLQSYYDESQPWRTDNPNSFDRAIIWTKGYKHSFYIYEDWLHLDDVRVMPVVEKSYDLSPDKLIERYQSGKWNGEKIYSKDFFTTAEIDSMRGTIMYVYERCLVEEYDYSRGMDWNTIHHQLVYRPKQTHGPAYRNWDVTIIDDISGSYDHIDGEIEEGLASSNQYVDLPNGRIDKEIIVTEKCNKEYTGMDGTFFVLNDEVRLYDKGELISSWGGFTHSEDAFLSIYGKDQCYYYSNGDVFQLRIGKEPVRLMTGVFAAYDDYEGTVEFTSLENGIVYYGCNQYDGKKSFRIVEIEQDVDAAIPAITHAFMKKTDGTIRVWDMSSATFNEFVTYPVEECDIRDWVKKVKERRGKKSEEVSRLKEFLSVLSEKD